MNRNFFYNLLRVLLIGSGLGILDYYAWPANFIENLGSSLLFLVWLVGSLTLLGLLIREATLAMKYFSKPNKHSMFSEDQLDQDPYFIKLRDRFIGFQSIEVVNDQFQSSKSSPIFWNGQ